MGKLVTLLAGAIVVVLLLIAASAHPAYGQSYDCTTLPTRLSQGMTAAVEDNNGLPNDPNDGGLPIYESTLHDRIGSIQTFNPDGSQPTFTIIGSAARCSPNGYLWWEIKTADGIDGWVHETLIYHDSNGVYHQVYTVKPYTPPDSSQTVATPVPTISALPCPDAAQQAWATAGQTCKFANLSSALCYASPQVEIATRDNQQVAQGGTVPISNLAGVTINNGDMGIAMMSAVPDGGGAPIGFLLFGGQSLAPTTDPTGANGNAYLLRTQDNSAQCSADMTGGVMIQSPDSSQRFRSIVIDGVTIVLHSTIFVQAQPQVLTVAVLEGGPSVSSANVTQIPHTGQFVTVPLNGDNTAPVGPPSLPQAWAAPRALVAPAGMLVNPVGLPATTTIKPLYALPGNTLDSSAIPGDVRYFTFQAVAGYTVVFTLTDTANKPIVGHVRLFLQGASTPILDQDYISGKTLPQLVLASAGTYVIAISPLPASGVLGDYNLHVDYFNNVPQ